MMRAKHGPSKKVFARINLFIRRWQYFPTEQSEHILRKNPDGACSLYFMNFTLDWLTNGADTYMAPGTERTEVPVFTPADGTKFEEGSEGQISIECGTPMQRFIILRTAPFQLQIQLYMKE